MPAHEIYEHIVKSPPEPTRVKSPEQIIMRSPDPVNWIVPLDTGKTFTVTQNIRNGKLVCVCVCCSILTGGNVDSMNFSIFFLSGDAVMRPQSEFKVSTPVDKPPSAPFSAPPNVIEQVQLDGK